MNNQASQLVPMNANDRNAIVMRGYAENYVDIQKQSHAMNQAIGLANQYSKAGWVEKMSVGSTIFGKLFGEPAHITAVNKMLSDAGLPSQFVPYSDISTRGRSSSEKAITIAAQKYAVDSLLDVYSSSIKNGDYNTARIASMQLNVVKTVALANSHSTKTNRDLQYLFLNIGDKAASGIVNLQMNSSLRNVLRNNDSIQDSTLTGLSNAIWSDVAAFGDMLSTAAHMVNMRLQGVSEHVGHISISDRNKAHFGELSDYTQSVSNAIQLGALCTTAYFSVPSAVMRALPSFITRSSVLYKLAKGLAAGGELYTIDKIVSAVKDYTYSNIEGSKKGKEQAASFYANLVALGATATYHKLLGEDILKSTTPKADSERASNAYNSNQSSIIPAIVLQREIGNRNVDAPFTYSSGAKKSIVQRCFREIANVPANDNYRHVGEVANNNFPFYKGFDNVPDSLKESFLRNGVSIIEFDRDANQVLSSSLSQLSPQQAKVLKQKNKIALGNMVMDVFTGGLPKDLWLSARESLSIPHSYAVSAYRKAQKYFGEYQHIAERADLYYNERSNKMIVSLALKDLVNVFSSVKEDLIRYKSEFETDKNILIKDIERISTNFIDMADGRLPVTYEAIISDSRALSRNRRKLEDKQGFGVTKELNILYNKIDDMVNGFIIRAFGEDVRNETALMNSQYKSVIVDSSIKKYIEYLGDEKGNINKLRELHDSLAKFLYAVRDNLPEDVFQSISGDVEDASQLVVSNALQKTYFDDQTGELRTSRTGGNVFFRDKLASSHLELMHGKGFANQVVQDIGFVLDLLENAHITSFNPSGTADKLVSVIKTTPVIQQSLESYKILFPSEYSDFIDLLIKISESSDYDLEKQLAAHLL
ncbi:MAG: hypothetical protein ACRCXT_00615, partial [Paraclostridium sp.]